MEVALTAASSPTVFFGLYEPEDYDLYRGGLLEGRVRLDPHSPETIGPRPDWGAAPTRSNYFLFNLHSLRWVYDLIRPGESGDVAALEQAGEIWDYWESCNPRQGSTHSHAWDDEHAVSWRAITLAYLCRVWLAAPLPAERLAGWRRLAGQHADFLVREENYRPFHNHGANNALGLLALGTTFAGELPEAADWVALAIQRAEQQMCDNVSVGGLHLEQSAFYHCYVLRTLLEIDRVCTALDRPLAADFGGRLDRMLDTTARIAGDPAVACCFPYSNPAKDALRVYPLLGSKSVSPERVGPGAAHFRRAVDAPAVRELTVDEEGGYAVFNAPPDELSVVFHTRILDVPHGHQDALGVYACRHGRRLLVLPSTLMTGDPAHDWPAYFHGPNSHNTVQVDDRRQQPPDRVRPGALPRLFESTKVQQAVAHAELAGIVTRIRRQLGWDHLPPRLRSTPRGGKVLGHGTGDEYSWVRARHETIQGVEHVRTIVKLGEHALLVEDRVSGARQRLRQTWHFVPGADVILAGQRGEVVLDGAVVARFVQLGTGHGDVLRGVESPERAGWYGDSRGEPSPCCALRYEAQTPAARFVWLFQADAGALQGELASDGTTLNVVATDGTYDVRLDDVGVEVVRA